jgi:hypothetical protein
MPSPVTAQIVSDHQNNTYYTVHLRTSSHLLALHGDNEPVNPVLVSGARHCLDHLGNTMISTVASERS